MSKSIDYGNLMHQAMRSLIQKVLEDVQSDGLPGEHHFFITFDTRMPGVEIAEWLSSRYPSEMTVVVQHWYDNLEVTDDGFSITLNFGDAPEPLYIPFDSIRTFVDPSVEFGLRFESQTSEDEEDEVGLAEVEDQPAEAPVEVVAEEKETAGQDADVVSLDSFRKS